METFMELTDTTIRGSPNISFKEIQFLQELRSYKELKNGCKLIFLIKYLIFLNVVLFNVEKNT